MNLYAQAAESRRVMMCTYSCGPFMPIEFFITRDGLMIKRHRLCPSGTLVAFITSAW